MTVIYFSIRSLNIELIDLRHVVALPDTAGVPMLKFVILNSIAAAIILALSLSLIVVLASMAPEAKAEILQADIVAAPPCLLQGWPYYEPRCQFNAAGSAATRT